MKSKLRQILILFAVALVATLSSCESEFTDENPKVSKPSADFAFEIPQSVGFSNTKGTALNNQTVIFTNLSRSYTTITWDFGDGTTSTEKYPTHKYAANGTFNVTLKVSNGGSDEISITKAVKNFL